MRSKNYSGMSEAKVQVIYEYNITDLLLELFHLSSLLISWWPKSC